MEFAVNGVVFADINIVGIIGLEDQNSQECKKMFCQH